MENADPVLKLRVRPFWEAVDAGILLLRTWLAPVLWCYVVPVVLVAAVLGWVFGADLPWLPIVLLWWFRPVFDRLILGWAGERFFRPDASWKVLASQTWKSFDAAFWADVTYRRFSPWAGFLTPVSFLEGGNFAQRRKRRKWLSRDLGGPLCLLAFACAMAELGIAMSLWTSAFVLFSPGLWGASEGFTGAIEGAGWTVFAALTQVLVQPVYVLSCFSLYVGTRTRKEGWDLALAFRALRALVKPVALLLLVGGLSLAAVPRLSAEAFTAPTEGPEPAQAQVWSQIVSGREFGYSEPSWKMKWKKDPFEKLETAKAKDTAAWEGFGAEFLRGLALVLGAVAVASLVGYGVWTALGRQKTAKPKPVAAAPIETPKWRDEVLELWAAGRQREALAHLYQAALRTAATQSVTVPAAATEGDCLRLLAEASVDPALRDAVSGLVALWSETAWAGRPPSEVRFYKAVDALAGAGGAA